MRPPPSPILSPSSAMPLHFMRRPALPSPHAADDWGPADPADLLPSDPFGMDPGAIASWIADFGDLRVDFGDLDGGGEDDYYYGLLPSDPFGMDLSTTTAAIAGWMEDLGADIRDLDVVGGDRLFQGLRCFWDNSLWLYQEYGRDGRGSGSCSYGRDASELEEQGGDRALTSSGYGSGGESVLRVNEDVVMKEEDEEEKEKVVEEEEVMEGIPRYAFVLALGYLEVQDLLVLESVCKSLRSLVRSDSDLWRSIVVDEPLCDKITDDSLFRLTERAQGNLQSLSLWRCPHVTNDGLRRVLQNSPKLTKLSIPGCKKINIDGLINYLKELKSVDRLAIKMMKIGLIPNVTEEHYEDLKFLLGINQFQKQKRSKPQFFHIKYLFIHDDDPILDIVMCPRCQKPRLVYDCPAESCQHEGANNCSGCSACIARCIRCGRCVRNLIYIETFFLECICFDCGGITQHDHARFGLNVVAMF